MGKNQIKPSTPSISRRSGIDRRWITTTGYHPERRSGKDRRSTPIRSFLTPIDSNDQRSQKNPFRDQNVSDVSTRADELEDTFHQNSLSPIAQTAFMDSPTDD